MCTVSIAGISSKLAVSITKELLKRPDVFIRGSCRDITKLPTVLKNSAQVTLTNSGPFDKEVLRSLIKGVDVAICCYFADNKTMEDGQKLLVDLCEEEGVTRYVASDYTADYTKLNPGDIQLKDPMKHVKAYLETKSAVKGVHVLVGILTETFWSYFAGWDPDLNTLRYSGSGLEKWDLTTYHTAAQYVAAVALDPDATVAGDQISFREVAQTIDAVLGVTPKLEQAATLQDIFDSINPTDGDQNPLAAGAYYMMTGKISLGTGLDNMRYPQVKAETFADFLRVLNRED